MLENKAQLLASTLEEDYSRLERLHTNIFLIKNGGIPQMNEIIKCWDICPYLLEVKIRHLKEIIATTYNLK